MEHLEIEFKMLLKENIFKKILSDYKNQIKDSYQQTNYYLFHPLLEKKKYSLRIREKKGHYELTLKRPSTIGLNELNIDINKEIKDAILIINISIMKSLIFRKRKYLYQRFNMWILFKNNTS